MKVEAIEKMAPPKNVKGVKSFLGLSGFYRRFIQDYTKFVGPLSRMTRKNAAFHWTPEAESAWKLIKSKLSSNPILVHPDLEKGYYLIFDASSYMQWVVYFAKREMISTTRCKLWFLDIK